jgi:hypothetical protein
VSQIKLFFHCRRCMVEARGIASPSDYQQIEAGWTDRGFQVWCKRHDINVAHVDFEGVTHPADLTERGDFHDPQTH